MTTAFHRIWKDQCIAAEAIREQFGAQKARDYLVGEKFLNFLAESDRNADFAGEIGAFVERVQEILEPHEIVAALDAALPEAQPSDPFDGETFDDLEYEAHDIVAEAERVMLVERAREI